MVVAIDPGSKESAIISWDGKKIFINDKVINEEILNYLWGQDDCDDLIIEEINPYSMGMTIRDTILWSGRFQQYWIDLDPNDRKVHYISRNTVRQTLCGMGGPKINDKVIRQALIDRFGAPGTKKNPGMLYGIKADMWSALALAVTFTDLNR